MNSNTSFTEGPSPQHVPAGPRTLPHLFVTSVARFAENPLFWEKTGAEYTPTSYREMKTLVDHFAGGLLGLGIARGDRVALLSQARRDWVVSELGVLFAGAISVPLSVKLESSELIFRLQHSGARVLVTSSNQYPKVRGHLQDIPELEYVILMDPLDDSSGGELLMEHLMDDGRQYIEKNRASFDHRMGQVGEDDCALISYTSGTTADPKGIMLSHKNLVANTEQALQLFSVTEDFRILLILPLDHSFAHTTGMYVFIASGASLASVQLGRTPAASLKNVFTNIREIRPDALLSVPTVARNLRKNIENGVRKKGKFTWRLFQLGRRAAYKYNGLGVDRGRGWRMLLWPLCWAVDRLVFKAIRQNFGGRLKYFVGGGALLDLELQKFFYAIGMPMYQGYGLSEASPVISSNTVEDHKLGTSGRLVPDLDLRICDEGGNPLPAGAKGEIVVSGDNVMMGYYRNEEATRDTLRDGWLYTGDMGFLDEEGFLHVLGRFKSLLIGDDGEKYSPEGIEECIEENSRYIQQIMIHNNQRPYTTALIFPDVQNLILDLERHHPGLRGPDAARQGLRMIAEELDTFRNGREACAFPQRWLPASFAILEEGFTEQNHFLNSTMKMVRGRITDHYHDRIEYMYQAAGKDIGNAENVNALSFLLEG